MSENGPVSSKPASVIPPDCYRTASSLDGLAGLRHGFFGRAGGISTGLYTSLNCGPGSADDPEAVTANRARVAHTLGVTDESRLVTLYQIHSGTAVPVTAPWTRADAPKADGMATNVPGIVLGALAGDCCPVLFADREARVIGAAHAGWRGAFDGVLEATLEVMTGLGAERGRIAAALGPTISQDNYEVGPEFKERFLERDRRTERFFRPSARADHFMFDLPAYAAARLEAAGVGVIEDLKACTYGDDAQYFSKRRSDHRNEGDYGRNISAIVLTGKNQ